MSNAFDSKPRAPSSEPPATTSSSEAPAFSLDGFLGGLLGTEPATPAPPRLVQGKGNYIYKQDPDGTITIVSGPARVGEVHAPGTPVGDAITAQIGPYRSPIPSPAAAPSSGGFDPMGWLRGLLGGGEAPTGEPPSTPPSSNPAFGDGTRTVEGSTLDVAGSRLGMETTYELGQTDEEREAMRTGDQSATSFFCSGFNEWTLAASGYDVKEPIRGTDGVAFSYTDARATERPGTPVTLGMLINGQAEAVTTMAEVQRTQRTAGGWVLHIDASNLRSGFTEGVAAGETAMKGAAGAFELAGIGAEVPESAQRPGDFAQARWSNEGAHVGSGHAWQVWSVRVLGAAMFGKPGSPRPVAGQLDGWHAGVEFVIDDATDPSLVGEILATTAAERIEANVAGARGGSQDPRQDKAGDGGVGVSRFVPVPDTVGPQHYKDYVVFYGRLSSSKWATWKPALPTEEDR